MIWLIRKHPYTPALIYFKKIFHFLTFQTSKLPKTVAKKTKNMTSFPCSVRSADFLPYMHVHITALPRTHGEIIAGLLCTVFFRTWFMIEFCCAEQISSSSMKSLHLKTNFHFLGFIEVFEVCSQLKLGRPVLSLSSTIIPT